MKALMFASVAGLALMAAMPAKADFYGHVGPFGFYAGPDDGYAWRHHRYWYRRDGDWRWRHYHHYYHEW